tara:strand:+ start:658 stop:1200 length:543 start_codon:yes stop_codon:yes gene_type:complete
MIDIIEATSAHVPDLARIHLASKLPAEKGIVDPEYLASFSQEIYEEKWTRFLQAEDAQQYMLFDEGVAVGLISFGKLRTAPSGTSKIRPLYSSEIYAIYIHPDHFQKGYGKALFKKAVQKLREEKHKSLCLWALEKNKNAGAFYSQLKGERVGKQQVQMGRYKVTEACYAWRNISVIEEL